MNRSTRHPVVNATTYQGVSHCRPHLPRRACRSRTPTYPLLLIILVTTSGQALTEMHVLTSMPHPLISRPLWVCSRVSTQHTYGITYSVVGELNSGMEPCRTVVLTKKNEAAANGATARTDLIWEDMLRWIGVMSVALDTVTFREVRRLV